MGFWTADNVAAAKALFDAGAKYDDIENQLLAPGASVGRLVAREGWSRRRPGDWSQDKIDRGKALWDQGAFAGAIGAALGCSKSAVLGQAMRQGWTPRRGAPGLAAVSTSSGAGGAVPRQVAVNFSRLDRVLVAGTPGVDADLVPLAQRRTFQTIGDRECRWPFGDPGTPGFFFCGGAVEGRGPYCRKHKPAPRGSANGEESSCSSKIKGDAQAADKGDRPGGVGGIRRAGPGPQQGL